MNEQIIHRTCYQTQDLAVLHWLIDDEQTVHNFLHELTQRGGHQIGSYHIGSVVTTLIYWPKETGSISLPDCIQLSHDVEDIERSALLYNIGAENELRAKG